MYSPLTRTPIAMAKNRKREGVSNMSSRRSCIPSPATVSTPRNSSFGRSFVDSILEETSNCTVQSFGTPIPVLVTEAMSIPERITDISVKLEPFGYASLVCGRQLLIWKYKLESGGRTVAHCKELTLPPSDLAHKAELVHLFHTEDSKLPSALAVSPEGHVRYWPNINHEGSSVDAVTDLQGQECYSLTSIFPLGCILATTTSSLVIVTPTIGEGQPSVICRTLTLPMGVLAGIGRKVSSFIFGVVPSQTSETKQLNRVLSIKGDYDDYFIYVLSSCNLQKWHVKDKKDNSDQLLFELDLDRQLKQSYIDEVFKKDSSVMSNLKTWCLDMQLCSSGVMIFTAGTVLARSDRNMCYAFGVLNTLSDISPQSFSTFYVTEYSEIYEEEKEEKLLNYKFILPSFTSQSAFIYNAEKVLCIQLGSHVEVDELNFKSSGNLILGSGTCDGLPLFFTAAYGIISIMAAQKSLGNSRFLTSVKDVSITHSDQPAESSESISAKLRRAMFSHCQGDKEDCERILNEILPKSKSRSSSDLDEAVITLSLRIIDDYPFSDPRWCDSVPAGYVSSSLIILYQLDDKLKAHECLLDFLKAYDIFNRLTTSKIDDVIISTNVLLCEHAEKLVAAKTLRLFFNDHGEVIENAIQDSLNKRGIEVKSHLTPQDVFFREVSAFHNIFSSFIQWEEEEIAEEESLSKILNVIMAVNKIFMGLLNAVTEYRQSKGEIYGLENKDNDAEFLPWTAREENSGIRSYIRKQLNINLNHGLKITDSIQIQGILYQQYVEIMDIFLASYKSQLDSLKTNKQASVRKEFQKQRNEFIKPLLNLGQYERAAAIAEKYLDFDILIQICEETQNSDRLQRYMLQFADQKFPEYVFKWYFNKGQRGKIFDKNLGPREDLGNFLQSHESLKWLHYIQEEQYEAAHLTLKELALKETQFLSKKKTLLSLSKLVAMISNVPEETKRIQIEALNLEQDLITHQEALPMPTVEAYGLNPQNMRVFTPEELIEMYITDENTAASAYDFKIALDLLNFMKKPLSDPEVNNLRLHIWSKAVLRDNWEELDISSPLEAIKETLFFQIIELAFDQGVEMHDFIPPVDELLQSPELRNLADNCSFKFLLQAGYEYILKIID